jgi:hypothetical protein
MSEQLIQAPWRQSLVRTLSRKALAFFFLLIAELLSRLFLPMIMSYAYETFALPFFLK